MFFLLNVVNYNHQAVDSVKELTGNVDFGVFMIMITAVIVATIGVTVGITALKKGISWLIKSIKDISGDLKANYHGYNSKSELLSEIDSEYRLKKNNDIFIDDDLDEMPPEGYFENWDRYD